MPVLLDSVKKHTVGCKNVLASKFDWEVVGGGAPSTPEMHGGCRRAFLRLGFLQAPANPHFLVAANKE